MTESLVQVINSLRLLHSSCIKLDSNYTRMLRAVLNKSWRPHSTKQQLYGHLSQKLSELDKPDMQDTAGEVRMNS